MHIDVETRQAKRSNLPFAIHAPISLVILPISCDRANAFYWGFARLPYDPILHGPYRLGSVRAGEFDFGRVDLVTAGSVIHGEANLCDDCLHARNRIHAGVFAHVHRGVSGEEIAKSSPVLCIEEAAIARLYVLDRFLCKQIGKAMCCGIHDYLQEWRSWQCRRIDLPAIGKVADRFPGLT